MSSLQKTNYKSSEHQQAGQSSHWSPSSVDENPTPYLVPQSSEFQIPDDLSIAIIGPDERRRAAAVRAIADCAATTVREFPSYPADHEEVPRLLEQQFDVIIIDLDSDPEPALELVECIGSQGPSTLMVYSSNPDPELLVRCMRAGAREFLTVPLAPEAMAEALVRAAARRPAARARKTGKLLVFMGAKGGVGVTSVACNFAVALAQEPDQKTLLIDLDLPLGDAALNFGIVSEFSTVNALQATDRLDAAFLSKLLVKHSSGVYILAAPGRFPHFEPPAEAIEKLLLVARQEFDNVVVDVGSRLDLPGTALFSEASKIYLVTQAGIPELRNANRLINQFFSAGNPKLEIILNRHESRTLGVAEEHITKALTRPVQWKIPNDHALVRKMQINATPLVLGESAMAKLIRQMAQSVIPQQAAEPIKKGKKGFSLFS
jgi:pilus assembly protein CpaE